MQALKCDFCGGNLVIDNSREFANCEFCGTKYSKDLIKEKIQEIRGKVEITNPVQFVKGDAELERIAANAEQFVKLGAISKAREEFENLINNFPEDYRGWLGLARLAGFGNNIHDLKRALILSKNNEAQKYIDKEIKRYGDELHLETVDEKVYDFSLNEIETKTIDEYTHKLLFDVLSDLLDLEYQPLTMFLYNLSKQYLNMILEGKIIPYKCILELPSNLNVQKWCSNEVCGIPKYFADYFGYKFRAVPNRQSSFYVYVKATQKFITVSYKSFYRVFGKWLLIFCEYYGYKFILLPKVLTESELRKIFELCPYCGSEFKGVITLKCSNPNCQRVKDY